MTSDLAFAHRLADAADAISRPYVGLAVDSQMKEDGSPVTTVDGEVEERLLRIVSADRAQDGWISEELGAARPGNRRWIVDGIDGTAAFRIGRPEWATLIALEDGSGVAAAVATAPGLGRRWWAESGGGAWTADLDRGGLGPAKRLAVTTTAALCSARIGSWPPTRLVRPEQQLYAGRWLRSGLGLTVDDPAGTGHVQRPSWGRGYPGAGLIVAAGELDAAILFGGDPWDHAVPCLIVTEAGGRASAFDGSPSLDRGHFLFSNGPLHDGILAVLRE